MPDPNPEIYMNYLVSIELINNAYLFKKNHNASLNKQKSIEITPTCFYDDSARNYNDHDVRLCYLNEDTCMHMYLFKYNIIFLH